MSTISFSNNLYFKQESNVNYYSTDNTNWLTVSSLPITLNYTGSSTGYVYLNSNFNISSVNFYFIFGSPNITFNGSNKNMLMNVSLYPGLFNNGSFIQNGYSNIIIKNINILSNSGINTLATGAGWFCQESYSHSATNNILDNLFSNCTITRGSGVTRGGGICGNYCGRTGGSVTIQYCSTSGNISGTGSGGICGDFCGALNGTVTINNCYSTGSISANGGAGGIIGPSAGRSNGTVTINNCYSTGNISGSGAGGIVGWQFGDTSNKLCQINKCYSTGNISGDWTGGIAGVWCGYNGNNLCQITNCYSLGNITGFNAGGIVGAQVGYVNDNSYTPQVLISNCYSNGTVNAANNCGSICGGDYGVTYSKSVNVTIENCYTVRGPFVSPTLQGSVILTITNTYNQNGTWNSPTASNYLLNAPVYSGNTFVSNGSIYAAQNPTSNIALPFLLITTQETLLTNFNVSTPQIVGSIFTIVPPTSNREGPFEYSSSNNTIAEIIDNTYVQMKMTGNNITITATQPAIDGWTEGIISTIININTSTLSNPTPVNNYTGFEYALTNKYVTTIQLIENNIGSITNIMDRSGTNKKIICNKNITFLN
jgi:hypothetical protein